MIGDELEIQLQRDHYASEQFELKILYTTNENTTAISWMTTA